MPVRPIRIDCGRICLIQSDSRGRRPNRRVLRGGSFNNQTSNVRSASRNNNQPDNRNNNNGVRAASTLRRGVFPAMPESTGGPGASCGACECEVQVVVPCRMETIPFGQINNRSGRAGRSSDSNVLPGHSRMFAVASGSIFGTCCIVGFDLFPPSLVPARHGRFWKRWEDRFITDEHWLSW